MYINSLKIETPSMCEKIKGTTKNGFTYFLNLQQNNKYHGRCFFSEISYYLGDWDVLNNEIIPNGEGVHVDHLGNYRKGKIVNGSFINVRESLNILDLIEQELKAQDYKYAEKLYFYYMESNTSQIGIDDINSYFKIIESIYNEGSVLNRTFDLSNKSAKVIFDKIKETLENHSDSKSNDYLNILHNLIDISNNNDDIVESNSNIISINFSEKKEEPSLVEKYRNALNSDEVKLVRDIINNKNGTREKIFKALLKSSIDGETNLSSCKISEELNITARQVSREIEKLIEVGKLEIISSRKGNKASKFKIT